MIALLLVLAACDTSKPDGGGVGDTAADSGAPDTAGDGGVEDSGGVDSGADTGDGAEDSGETGISPVDADGDGHASVQTGGDDCDDGDPWAYPGATEWCDQVDQDCDGEALAEGACAGVQELGPTTTLLADTITARIAEGMGDEGASALLFFLEDAVGGDDGTTMGWSAYANEASAWPLSPPEDALHTWARGCMSGTLLEAGDVDGDGVPDLAIAESICYRVRVVRGPVPRDGATTWLSDADTWWSSPPVSYDGWGDDVAAGGDFDGDGRTDVVAPMSTWTEASDDEFHVFYGGEFGERYVAVQGPGTTDEATVVEDVDGDGLSDLLMLDYADVWLVSGGDLRSADGAWVDDLAIATTYPYPGEAGALDQAWASVGDRTGDGLSDLAAVGQGAEQLGYEHGAVYVFDAGTRGEFDADDALGSWVGIEGGEIGGWIRRADMDGDGDVELAVWARFEDTFGTVFLPGGAVPAPYTSIAEAGALRLAEGMPAYDGGDLDGDGYEDWVLHDSFVTESAYVLYGWDVPWGEEPWW